MKYIIRNISSYQAIQRKFKIRKNIQKLIIPFLYFIKFDLNLKSLNERSVSRSGKIAKEKKRMIK